MLHDAAEVLAIGRAQAHEVGLREVRSGLVELIEEQGGRIARGPEIAEDREGRGSPGPEDGAGPEVDGLVAVGGQASLARGTGAGAAHGVEGGEPEIRRRRTARSRDGG